MYVIPFEIHGIDWEVNILSKDDDEAIVGGVGECNYCTYTIYIVDGLTKTQFRSVLIHEVTHAFRWTYGLVSERERITIPTAEIEEIIANSIETFAEDILVCVQEIMDYLFKAQEEEAKKKKEKKKK